MFAGWTSFRVFLMTTWASFESEFADISVRLDGRMLVVVRTAAVTEYERTHVESKLRAEAEAGNNPPCPTPPERNCF